MKRTGLVILLVLACLPLAAQQMSVEEFAKVRRMPWNKTIEVDKASAIVDFVTEEKGFTFLANGKVQAEAQEGDGMVTVKFPKKTKAIVIRHPSFGQYTWKSAKNKSLKVNSHYRALLFASDPTVDFKAPKQWVIFRMSPANTLLTVDSLSKQVRSDIVEMYLPVGKHSYRVESPFYDAEEGSFELSDSVRVDIPVRLQPFYSYLTVKPEWRGRRDLYIDLARISKKEATSLRMQEGWHRVNVFRKDKCCYDSLLLVGRAEKKLLTIADADLHPLPLKLTDPMPVAPPDSVALAAVRLTPIKITAHDPQAEIWVDLEKKAVGEWEDSLSLGIHFVEARKEGVSSSPLRLLIEDSFPKEITLEAAGAGYGLVNIHCNVAGADITIDGKDYGQTPKIVRLEATRNYRVTLSKDGYKAVSQKIPPRGNNLTDVYMKLKKKKRI